MKKNTSTIEALKEKVQEIKEKNLLPQGYGQAIADELGITRNKVYRTMSGHSADLDIIALVIKLAKDNKEKRLLEEATKLLED